MTNEMASRVKEILTSSKTATLGTAKQVLAQENVFLGRSTIHRIAQREHLSNQKIALKPDIVFTERMAEMRFDYAEEDGMFDEELWFLDETGFNLHVAPNRCWSEVGETPVQPVTPGKGQNLHC